MEYTLYWLSFALFLFFYPGNTPGGRVIGGRRGRGGGRGKCSCLQLRNALIFVRLTECVDQIQSLYHPIYTLQTESMFALSFLSLPLSFVYYMFRTWWRGESWRRERWKWRFHYSNTSVINRLSLVCNQKFARTLAITGPIGLSFVPFDCSWLPYVLQFSCVGVWKISLSFSAIQNQNVVKFIRVCQERCRDQAGLILLAAGSASGQGVVWRRPMIY